MTRQLVFVHGRAQQGKEPGALKNEWLVALNRGLAASGRSLPIAECDVRFPYYGDTLDQMARGRSAEAAAAVIQRGGPGEFGLGDDAEDRFIRRVFAEVQQQAGITDEEVAEFAEPAAVRRGALNWSWTQAMLRAVDRHLPGGSAAGLLLATRDVYRYLTDPAVRERLETGVAEALAADRGNVVVAHSLGSVVAYNVLRHEESRGRRPAPLFLTLGSPLGVTAIRAALRRDAPHRFPADVSRWVNAMDVRDFVALYPLTPQHFPLSRPEPAISNHTEVDNHTPNRHGIDGYLDDSVVALAIHDALTAH